MTKIGFNDDGFWFLVILTGNIRKLAVMNIFLGLKSCFHLAMGANL